MAEESLDIDYVATLARIDLRPEEREDIGASLGEIVRYIEKLGEVNIEGVEPTSHPHPLKNVFREDVRKECLAREDALANAPETTGPLFRTPKIVE